ncbi:hypothetical protein C8R42DRAFT_641045 [Lentinula raphanica]|nr:hypothetical protein C8R42DRAFT_641045 [Lentinula raphanica]
MAMLSWTEPWFENDVAFELRVAAEAFRRTLQVRSGENPVVQPIKANNPISGDKNDESNVKISRNAGWVKVQRMIHVDTKLRPWRNAEETQQPGSGLELHECGSFPPTQAVAIVSGAGPSWSDGLMLILVGSLEMYKLCIKIQPVNVREKMDRRRQRRGGVE